MAHIRMVTFDFNVESGDDDRTEDYIMADDMEEALVMAEGIYRDYVHDDDPNADRVAMIFDAQSLYGDALYINYGEGWEEQAKG